LVEPKVYPVLEEEVAAVSDLKEVFKEAELGILRFEDVYVI
jgi:hypothetical protein